MKRISASVILLLLAAAMMAQNEAPLTRQEKKAVRLEQKKQAEGKLTMSTSEALRSGHFVLKADQVMNRGGILFNVDPTVNFVAVEGKEAYVQVSPSSYGPGRVTLKGKITSMDINQRNKDGSYNIIINTFGVAGNYTVVINMNKTGEAASASVSLGWGNRLEMRGSLYPWNGTGTFKGKRAS